MRWRLTALAILAGVALLAIIYVGVSVAIASVLTEGTHKPVPIAAEAIWPAHQDVAFASRDRGIRLSGWLFHAGSARTRSIIMVSGRRQTRVDEGFDTADIARNLLDNGYDVLLFDLRGTGLSGGDRPTLGSREPRDLLGAYDFMRAQGYPPEQMAMIGDSMGGAVVLDAAPQLAPVGALVADSAFAALRPILERELPPNSLLPSFFNWGIITAGHLLFGIDPDLRPADAVRGVPDRAFLFFQGTADTTVPLSNGPALRSASANAESKLVIVPGAAHVKSYRQDPRTYLQILLAFISQQMSESRLAVR